MRRRYDSELLELPETLRAVLESDRSESVENAIRVQRPMVFVGSGGALAVAQLAADLHTKSTGELAVATTPLVAATAQLSSNTGVVLFSARAKHPDAALTIDAARARGAAHVGVVTSRSREELPPSLRSGDVWVGTVPSPRDGFLATNSLLAMAAAICIAHDVELPAVLPAFDQQLSARIRESCLVLTGPGTASIGVDVEARLVETGLASVQLADYRNLAHGRHVGLVRNLSEVTVVGVVDPASAGIAESTLDILPPDVDLVTLRSELEWPISVLDLLVQSMQLTSTAGHAHGVDPGKPGVQEFGRRLYHLPVKKLLSVPQPDPISRKLFVSDKNGSARPVFEEALKAWLQIASAERVAGIVLDYDGTCVPTWDRFRPPPSDVQDQVVRLLEAGIVVGFATGRGRSLHETTRTWLPKVFWPSVHVGLYNGTLLLKLADNPPNVANCHGPLAEAADRLEALGLANDLLVERRQTQVSVSAPDSHLSGTQLLPLVRSVLARPPTIECKVLASGHAVDVVAPDAGKVAVLEAVAADCAGAVLAIGDQGQVDGNDFELLAATTLSISVDRCSADPTRCWNLDRKGVRGAPLLTRYLSSIQQRSSGHRFVWQLK